MSKWLSIVGIGEDGLKGLGELAQSLIAQAEILVGGMRHLAMLPPEDTREKLVWATPITTTIEQIIQRRGQAICILASGDPMCHGIGVTLTKRLPIEEMLIVPTVSAFSLACARLGWSLAEIETFSLTNRPTAVIASALYPGARLLVLSADKYSPEKVAKFLTERGYGKSQITVLERMGGVQEHRIDGVAATWKVTEVADLNTIAILCVTDTLTISLPHTAGLPDAAYQHDGQLTKQEVRAITLANLAPIPGQLLWDVGAGCGSIAIEWLRSHGRCRAIAIERHPTRLQYIADNAVALGVPQLQIIPGEAPLALKDLPQPDAIFIGGGVTNDNLFETCWKALPYGSRLVINAVTLESEQKVLQWHNQYGGSLTRINIERTKAIGSFLGWKPLSPVIQWVIVKP